MSRAGLALRQKWALERAGDKLCTCGHTVREHLELHAVLYELDGTVIVEKPNPDYEPLAFHCRRDGCDCVVRQQA